MKAMLTQAWEETHKLNKIQIRVPRLYLLSCPEVSVWIYRKLLRTEVRCNKVKEIIIPTQYFEAAFEFATSEWLAEKKLDENLAETGAKVRWIYSKAVATLVYCGWKKLPQSPYQFNCELLLSTT